MNLETMCQLCPALVELTAKISCDVRDGRWRMSSSARMPLLKVAKVRLETAEVLPALLSCTPQLTVLEIFYEQDCSSPDLDDIILSQALRSASEISDPPALEVRALTLTSWGWETITIVIFFFNFLQH
jgi:hypothetical protein